MPNDQQRPRQPSRPDLHGPGELDRTPWGAENQRRADQPKRTTLTSLPRVDATGALVTVPAPRQDAPTLRATPAVGTPAQTPDEAVQEALRRRAEDAEREVVELRRRERVRAESDSPAASFPPTVTVTPAKPVEAAKEPDTDAVIGWLVKRAVANRKAIYGLVAALGLGGGGVAIKEATKTPQPPPLTMAQLEQVLEKQRTRKGGTDDQTRLLNELLQLAKCQRRKVTQIGESVLPAPDHMGAVRKPQPFEDDCPDSPKPLPDP